MPKPRIRYQVFVSSTYLDLRDERQAAVEAILRAGHIPAGMELFAAQNKPQMDVIKEWIEESDIFCLILGARYGSIQQESGKSYVELEYDHAISLNKPIFSLVLDEKTIDENLTRLGRKVVLEQENEPLFKAFRQRITSTLVRIVAGPDSIKVAVFEAIASLERAVEIDGWIRARDARPSSKMGEEIARLSAENARLTKVAAAADRSREALIDGRSVKEWADILGSMTIQAWSDESNSLDSKERISLHKCLLMHGVRLGAGVDNGFSAGPHGQYLFQIASALMSLGLAEALKTPPRAHWQRLGLSGSGKKLYAALVSQQVGSAAMMSAADFAQELLKGLSERANSTPDTKMPTTAPPYPGTQESDTKIARKGTRRTTGSKTRASGK